jgi:hypothetical protein
VPNTISPNRTSSGLSPPLTRFLLAFFAIPFFFVPNARNIGGGSATRNEPAEKRLSRDCIAWAGVLRIAPMTRVPSWALALGGMIVGAEIFVSAMFGAGWHL